MPDIRELKVHVSGNEGLFPEELEDVTRSLMNELSYIPDIAIDRSREGVLPPGAKAVDPATVADLLIKIGIAGVQVAVPMLFNTVREWLGRRPKGTKIVVKHGDLEYVLESNKKIDDQSIVPLIEAMTV